MTIFTSNDLILFLGFVLILFLLFISKSKSFSKISKIFKCSLKIVANNKKIFIWNALLPAFFVIFSPIIFMLFFLYINSKLVNFNFSIFIDAPLYLGFILRIFFLVLGFIWMITPYLFIVIGIPTIVLFFKIVYYRNIFQELSTDEIKFSFFDIMKQEIRKFPKLFKLSLTFMSVRISISLLQFSMKYRFFVSPEKVNIKKYFSVGAVRQIMNYAVMDYVLYQSFPRRSIVKSYFINKNWLVFSVYGFILSIFAAIISLFIYIAFYQFALINLNFNDILEKVDPLTSMMLVWLSFSPLIISLSFLSLFLNSFYVLIYISYNNLYAIGINDKIKEDYGIRSLEQCYGYMEQFLKNKFGSQPIPIYEKYFPIKKEYEDLLNME